MTNELREMQAYDIGWQSGYLKRPYAPEAFATTEERDAYRDGYLDGESARYEEG